VDRATAHLTAWLVICSMAGGCAFPLFNVEERTRPRTLAYRPPPAPDPATTPAKPHTAAAERPTPILGPRRSSVLDPRPRELSSEATASACHSTLRQAGVQFERIAEPTPGVRWPIRLRGPIRGVLFTVIDDNRTHAILDCRLALSLLAWAPDLRRARVRRVEHFSMYRPGARVGGNGPISGHAHGLAIDAAKFELDSGVVVDVLADWEERERGGDPCPMRNDESTSSRLLRKVTCRAVDKQLFEVVLTPHYNKAHANHLHLERKLGADWMYVR
jgi:hypothetical protein